MQIEQSETEIRIADRVSEIMMELNIKFSSDNVDTPKRIAKMLNRELFASLNEPISTLDEHMTTFPAPNHNKIRVHGIKFSSICEHHWLPFTGYADIEYVPSDTIIGLSKIPRIVKFFSKKPQVQERLTEEIGKYLANATKARYVKVVLRDVRHSCVEIRGIESECTTDTEYVYFGDW